VAEEKIEPFRERIDAVREHRRKRDGARVKAALGALHARASDREAADLMEAIIEATQAGATLGEMAGVLRMAYGQPADPFGMLENPI
jgi:methylmalonyl-CoA mutase N-terminal domain/subunit